MLKRTGFFFCLAVVLLWLGWSAPSPTPAGDKPVTVYLFWTTGCPHCLHEKEFLAALKSRDQAVKVVALEVSGSRENRELLQQVGKSLQIDEKDQHPHGAGVEAVQRPDDDSNGTQRQILEIDLAKDRQSQGLGDRRFIGAARQR